MNKKVTVKGIDSLVRGSVKFNKRSVSMPISTWELIDTILKKIKLELAHSQEDREHGLWEHI